MLLVLCTLFVPMIIIPILQNIKYWCHTLYPALMTKTKRPSGKLKVQYQTHSIKKNCYKYSFVPRSIVQSINLAPVDHKQFKPLLVVWTYIWVATPICTGVISCTLYKCSLKRDAVIHIDTEIG